MTHWPGNGGFHRRDFLRLLSNGTLLLASGGLLTGCGGGGGGGSSPPNSMGTTGTGTLGTPVFAQTQPLTTTGGTISDPAHGVTLTVPSGTVTGPTNAQLQVYGGQRAGVTPTNFTATPNAVDVSLDPTALAAGQPFQIVLPAPGTYDTLGTMVLATNDSGTIIALAVTYSAANSTLTATITAEQFQMLTGTASGQAVAGRSTSARPHSISGVLHSIGVFAVTVGRAVGPAGGEFYVFDTTSNAFRSLTGSDTMSGKRNAVVVHGIFSDHNAMQPLGQIISGLNNGVQGPTPTGGSVGSVYDAVWCYQYNFGAHISDNGQAFAQALGAAMSGAKVVDIVCHSMGGLVSRWALEQAGLGATVNRLVTLDTPHEGVPLVWLQLLVYLLGFDSGIDIASIIPGINDLAAPVQVAGVTLPSTLTTLNSGASPYRATADYYTSAGSVYAGVKFGSVVVGPAINVAFGNVNGEVVINDGIVPQYSALSTVLTQKSASWANQVGTQTHTYTFPLNHNQIGMPSDPAEVSAVAAVISPWLMNTAREVIVQ